VNRSPEMQKFIDSITKEIHGKTLTEFTNENICPDCKQPVGEFRDEISRRENAITGLCQKCQDEIFNERYDFDDEYDYNEREN
jgi:hypothetical protein